MNIPLVGVEVGDPTISISLGRWVSLCSTQPTQLIFLGSLFFRNHLSRWTFDIVIKSRQDSLLTSPTILLMILPTLSTIETLQPW